MTAIAHPNRIIAVDDATKKVRISQDTIAIRIYTPYAFGGHKTIIRLNSSEQPIWSRSIFEDVPPPGGGTHPQEIALSLDKHYIYIVGSYEIDEDLYSLIKLDAATGVVVWTAEFTMYSYHIAVDYNDDIIIWGEVDPETSSTGTLMKFTSAGVWVWSQTYDDVTSIAVDSLNNIYIGHLPLVSGFGIQMLNSSGVAQKGGVVPTGAGYTKGIAISPDDQIFSVGSAYEISSGVYHRLFRWTEGASSLDLADSVFIGLDTRITIPTQIKLDSIGNIIADGGDYIDSYTYAFVRNWSSYTSDDDGTIHTGIAIDVHNRVHLIGVVIHGTPNVYGGTLILDKDGNQDSLVPQSGAYTGQGIFMAREVYVSHYTDQSENRFVEDVCCFLDDTIPEWNVTIGSDGTPQLDDIYYNIETSKYWESLTGIFKSLANNNMARPGQSESMWLRLGDDLIREGFVPPCGNTAWNAFSGFGGIGLAPKVYTVTMIGLKKVSDGTPSEYNGEYLMIRGPGKFGFFFGVQHDNTTRMNFTLTDAAAGNETFQFGSDALPSSIFNYTDTATNTGKWIDIISSNLVGTADAIAYEGTASIYPDNIKRWDTDTTWESGIIVAWEGSFYTANNQNQSSEPPSGNWTLIA